MESRNKVRLVALLAAMVVTAGLAASIGPVASGVAHALHHWFASLSPGGRAIVKAVCSSVPYWLPGLAIAVVAGVAGQRSRRGEDADGESRRREKPQIARPS